MADESGPEGRTLTGWFVRRAGLARCTTFAAAIGVSLAALFPGRYPVALVGLTCALAGVLVGYEVTRCRPMSKSGLGLTLASVVLVGLLAGFLLGTGRISSLLDGRLSSHLGETVEAEVVVTGSVRASFGWQSATAVVQRIGQPDGNNSGPSVETGNGEKVLLEVTPPDGDAGGILTQGARLLVRGELRAPQGPSNSGFDQAKQLLHQGIEVVLRVQPEAVIYRGQRGGVSGWFDRLREAAKQHLALGPDARVNEVLQGVVMGDTAGIDDGWMEAFRRSGTAHMLSVSGLHVASLAAIIIALAGLARLSRRAGYIMGAAAAVLMVPFVGPSPPIIRAAAMLMVVLAGRLVGRRRDSWQGLGLAALVVLALNPFAVFDVGFQLSFSAFAGMIGLVGPLERLLTRFPDSVRANLAVSLAATLGTAPVSLVVFGRTSLVSPVANLLVVPTLAAVTGLGMASVFLGFIWHGLSTGLDTLASLPMAWTVQVSTVCARAPVLDGRSIGPVLFGAGAALLALPAGLALAGRVVAPPFGIPLPRFGRSLGWLSARRPRSRTRAVCLALAIVVAALTLGAAAYPALTAGLRTAQLLAGSRDWPSQVEVRALDVGQGTAVLVRTPQHHAALFDAGPAGCDLIDQLRELGVRRLDLVVISHPHADHFAGLLEAVDSLEVGTLVDRTRVDPAGSGEERGEGEAGQYLELRRRLAKQGCTLLPGSTGSSVDIDGVHVVFFAPPKPLVLLDGADPWGEGRSPPSGDELNAGSLVTLLTVGRVRVLLPGDAEADALESYHLPPTDVLVVPHHGSRDAVSGRLLAALRPKLGLVSVGEDNSFGHPDPGTIDFLSAAGATVVRTDDYGWVCLLIQDTRMTVSTERNRVK